MLLNYKISSCAIHAGGLDNCVKLWDTSKLTDEKDRMSQER